jgi:hypothetical protein
MIPIDTNRSMRRKNREEYTGNVIVALDTDVNRLHNNKKCIYKKVVKTDSRGGVIIIV